MKASIKKAATLLLTAFAALTPAAASAQSTDWAHLNRFREANKELMKTPDSRRVVFYGNSITEGWPTAHPAFFEENHFVGRGISGQTTPQYLVRFRQDVVNLKPQAVVINAATNDMAENTGPYNEAATMDNIRSLVEIAEANGIKVILTSTLPAGGFPWNKAITDAPEKIASLNKKIKAYAEEKGLPYVDYYSALLGPDGRSIPVELAKDGVHPTPEGYTIMEALILPEVRKIVK